MEGKLRYLFMALYKEGGIENININILLLNFFHARKKRKGVDEVFESQTLHVLILVPPIFSHPYLRSINSWKIIGKNKSLILRRGGRNIFRQALHISKKNHILGELSMNEDKSIND